LGQKTSKSAAKLANILLRRKFNQKKNETKTRKSFDLKYWFKWFSWDKDICFTKKRAPEFI
jgi:hypothetical protein